MTTDDVCSADKVSVDPLLQYRQDMTQTSKNVRPNHCVAVPRVFK